MTRAILCDHGDCDATVTEADPELVSEAARRRGWSKGFDVSGDRFDYCPAHSQPCCTCSSGQRDVNCTPPAPAG